MSRALPARWLRTFRRVGRHEPLRMAVLLAIAAFLLDWASKSWALQHLDGAVLPLGSLTLGVVRNSGFVFSLGSGTVSAEIVMAIRLTLLAALLLLCRPFNGMLTRRNACGLALLAAGGVGNSVDLVFRDGAVVDFIGAGPVVFDAAEASILPAVAFNAADLWILFGIGLLAPTIHELGRRCHERLAGRAKRGTGTPPDRGPHAAP